MNEPTSYMASGLILILILIGALAGSALALHCVHRYQHGALQVVETVGVA